MRHATAARHGVQRARVLPRTDGSHQLRSRRVHVGSPWTAGRAGTRAGPLVTPAASQRARAPHVARLERSTPTGRSGTHTSPGLPHTHPPCNTLGLTQRSVLLLVPHPPDVVCRPAGGPARGTHTCLAPMLALQVGRCGAPGVLVACGRLSDADRLRCTCVPYEQHKMRDCTVFGRVGLVEVNCFIFPVYCFGVTCTCGITHV